MNKKQDALAEVNKALWQKVHDDILMILDLLEIPEDLWRENGLACYEGEIWNSILTHPKRDLFEPSMLQNAERNAKVLPGRFALLCAAAPGKPIKALEHLSMAYGAYISRRLCRDDDEPAHSEALLAATATACIGSVLARLNNQLELSKKRRADGLKGLELKNKTSVAIADWAVRMSNGRADKATARQLDNKLPNDLRDATKILDTEAAIYRAIRKQIKRPL